MDMQHTELETVYCMQPCASAVQLLARQAAPGAAILALPGPGPGMAADLLPPRAIRAPTHRAAQRPQRSQWMQELPIDKPNPDASFASQPSPWAQTDGVVRTLSPGERSNFCRELLLC